MPANMAVPSKVAISSSRMRSMSRMVAAILT
jgi:hypothetical protein